MQNLALIFVAISLVLGKIGSNLTLKGKKLIINAATPFTFLQNALPSVREEFERIEPLKNEANTEQFAFFWPQFVLGWTYGESNPDLLHAMEM